MEPSHGLPEALERRAEEPRVERAPGGVLARGDEELVRQAAGVRGEDNEAVVEGDDAGLVAKLGREERAQATAILGPPILVGDRRRGLAKPGELRV
jgi:hypothetical protein